MTKDNISLSIPCKPDYISVVRLTTSAIANSMGLNIDEIEDIKVCIGEACVNVINQNCKDEIHIEYEIQEDKLTIKVNNVTNEIIDDNDSEDFRGAELGLFIINSLMDEVKFNEQGINMIKYIE